MNTFISILLVIVGIIILVAPVTVLMSVVIGKSKDVVSPAVNQKKDYPPINPNMIGIKVKVNPISCVVCGTNTFLPNGECISCGHPEPR